MIIIKKDLKKYMYIHDHYFLQNRTTTSVLVDFAFSLKFVFLMIYITMLQQHNSKCCSTGHFMQEVWLHKKNYNNF